jgi:hypothetical protein
MTLRHVAPRVNSALTACIIACGLPFAAHAQTQPAQPVQPARPSAAQTLPPGHPAVQQPSPQSVAAEGVRTTANIARGAADICHIDASKIARFKAVARKNFTDAPDFDGEWNLGYKEAQSTVDRFAALKTSDPQEYAQKIGEACPALTRGIDESTAGQ